MNPTAALHMANGKKIIIELLPEFAPNTVNSFIYVASQRADGSPCDSAYRTRELGRRHIHLFWKKRGAVSDPE